MKSSMLGCMTGFALIATLMFGTTPVAAADLTVQDSPETVLAESYRRMKAAEWVAAADTFDAGALKQFREMLTPILDAGEGAGVMAVFFGAEQSSETIKTMSDQAFFAKVIATMMQTPGGKLEGQEILGGISEGAERRHMVVRSTASAMGISITQMEVVSLNLTPQGWRLALSGKIDGMAKALQQLLAKPEAESAKVEEVTGDAAK
jgi:hypothetical protein